MPAMRTSCSPPPPSSSGTTWWRAAGTASWPIRPRGGHAGRGAYGLQILAGIADRLGVADAYAEGGRAGCAILYDQAWANAAAAASICAFEEFRAWNSSTCCKRSPTLLGAFEPIEGHPLAYPRADRLRRRALRASAMATGHPAWRAGRMAGGAARRARCPSISCPASRRMSCMARWDHAAFPPHQGRRAPAHPHASHRHGRARHRCRRRGGGVEPARALPCGGRAVRGSPAEGGAMATGAWFDRRTPRRRDRWK